MAAHCIVCDDRRLADMNRRFRGQSEPTDVLTFVYATSPARQGEIYVAVETARRQARARRVRLRDELLRLLVHGLAHLAGYDHHARGDFAAMRKKEFEALMQVV
ncbi:MAG: rRNA maturation RNase YbeY [Deltaproteobacteria bacterium]|nr:rRNA maturation RNase YbeY [Deltaproteobacteria bacterium]